MESSNTIDLERQRKAKEYSRISRRLMVADLLLSTVYVLAWLVFGWSAALKNWITGFTTHEWAVVILYLIGFGGIYLLLNLPLSFFQDYTLPHRFGQSTETLKGWVVDQVKGLVLSAVLGGLVLELIYLVLRAFPNTWWLWAAGMMLVLNVLLANLSPVLLLPLFNKFVPLNEEHAELGQRLMALAERAGTRVQGVYQFDMSRRTKSANAALTGLGNSRRIILGDTLINEFTPDEIETVLAHELGHQVNRDIPIGIVLQSGMTLVGLYLVSMGLRWGAGTFGFSGPSDVAALPVFGLVLGLYGLVTLPLSNGFSRWRERRADEFALRLTGRGAAYASALTRLANQNLADVEPEPWVEFFLHSHPALGKRIKMALAAEAAQENANKYQVTFKG